MSHKPSESEDWTAFLALHLWLDAARRGDKEAMSLNEKVMADELRKIVGDEFDDVIDWS